MEVDLPLYKLHFNKALGVFTRAVPIYLEINEDHAELKGSLTELMVSMDTMLNKYGRIPRYGTRDTENIE